MMYVNVAMWTPLWEPTDITEKNVYRESKNNIVQLRSSMSHTLSLPDVLITASECIYLCE